MTPEQLDEIEKLADEDMNDPWSEGEGAYRQALRDHALPLVKALREARAELGEALDELAFIKEEYGDGDPAEMTEDALLLKMKTITLDYNKARAEVERLRSVLRLLWEEAQDQERCANERAPGCYSHTFSQPCRDAVKAALKEVE